MSSEKPVLGFVGIGVMGQPISSRLLAAGYTVVGYDPDAAAMEAFSQAGGSTAGSAVEVANTATLVFTSLPTVAVFKQVLAGRGGLVEGSAVKVVVDLSTVGASATQEVAAALRQQGVELVDAPVSGGAAGAQEGTLAVMVAGQTRQVWHAAASQGGASDDLTAIVRFMERWSSSRE